jgi:hypothetical protein
MGYVMDFSKELGAPDYKCPKEIVIENLYKTGW